MQNTNFLDLLRDGGAHREMLLERWKDWLGEDADARFGKLDDDRERLAMAVLLENQWQYQRDTHPGQSAERILADTATTDEALFTRATLPMVRRVYWQVFQGSWSSVQPMVQPTSYVFFFDFVREGDSTNFLSVEYNYAITNEAGVPPKSKMKLAKKQINALKQAEGFTWTQEAEEDARAVLGIDVEAEVMQAGTGEFVRNLLARHLKEINNAARGTGPDATSTGSNLGAPQSANLAVTSFTARATNSDSFADYKIRIYNTLIDADVLFQKANGNRVTTGIVAGTGLAGFLQKLNTATSADNPNDQSLSSVGITNFGTYAGRWRIQGTNFLPDDQGFLYMEDPNPLFAGHVYAPYIPITAMPKVYAGYDSSTGPYTNTDEWTRNMRERSASTVVKPYSYAAITGVPGNTF